MVTVSDRKIGVDNNSDGVIDYYNADVITAGDAYSFGMTMPARVYTNGNNYRYSINGQEKTPEIAPNTTTAEFWQYDARIARRWNVDPVPKVFESPYAVFGNNPIWNIDYNGADTTKPEAAENGGKIKELEAVVVTGKQTKVSGLRSLLKESLINHRQHVWLGDRLINKIKDDDDYQEKLAAMKAAIMQDVRYEKEDFDVDLVAKGFTGLELGGKRHPDPMWKQALWQLVPIYGQWKYRKTWKVAFNELTWTLRHVTIAPTAHVTANGSIHITFKLTDRFDLQPSPGREKEYNAICKVLGPVYHDMAGGTPTEIHGTWSEYFIDRKTIENLFKPVYINTKSEK